MQATDTPIHLAKQGMKAMIWLVLAVPMGFLPVSDNVRAIVVLIPTAISIGFYWRTRWILRNGVFQAQWSDEQLDLAHVWMQSRLWTVIVWAAFLAYGSKFVGPWRNDFRGVGLLMVYPVIIMIGATRRLLDPPDPAATEANWAKLNLRSRAMLWRVRASSLPNLPPPPPWRFQLYQYPVKRNWTAEDFQRKR